MNQFLLRISTIAMSLATTVFALSAPAFAQSAKIYAAGSLRTVMQDLATQYAKEAPFEPQFLFGPSGKLREQIEKGESVALFASASPAHTAALVQAGKLRSQVLFARNSLCVAARPGISITTANLVATLLDPNIVLGASTPGADPAGDYTWEMFGKIDRLLRPGAFEILDKKAKKLVGSSVNASPNATTARSAYASLLLDRQADVFVTYCTNAADAARESSGITYAPVPSEVDVASDYSIGIAMDAPESARLFVRYITSARGQAVLSSYGFGRVPQSCEDLSAQIQNAHKNWTAPSARLIASTRARETLPIAVGTRTLVTLSAANQLEFARRDEGKRIGYGGSAQFSVAQDGHYEVFSTQRGWLDVVALRSGEALPSVRSDRWLGCAGVNKNLGFRLNAGERYQLQVSEITTPEVGLLIELIPAAQNR